MYSTPYCPIWCGYEVIIVEIMNVGRSNHGGNNGERGGGKREKELLHTIVPLDHPT